MTLAKKTYITYSRTTTSVFEYWRRRKYKKRTLNEFSVSYQMSIEKIKTGVDQKPKTVFIRPTTFRYLLSSSTRERNNSNAIHRLDEIMD